jgi:hypothetical protein
MGKVTEFTVIWKYQNLLYVLAQASSQLHQTFSSLCHRNDIHCQHVGVDIGYMTNAFAGHANIISEKDTTRGLNISTTTDRKIVIISSR